VLGSNVTAAVDHSVAIALGVLGIIYTTAALGAFIFIVIPRLMAGATEAAAAVPAVGVARARIAGVRWSPGYGAGVPRPQPGEYVPRQLAPEIQRLRRLYASPNRRFPVVSQV